MKKIFYIITVLVFITSCKEDDNRDMNNYTGDEQTYFTNLSLERDVEVSAVENHVFYVQVGSTITSNNDRQYSVVADPSSTAVEGVDYSISSNIVTIPANEYVAELEINTIFNGIPDDGSVLILNLVEINNYVSDFKNQFKAYLIKACDNSFVSSLSGGGTYSVTTTYGYHDFLPDFSSYTMTVQLHDLGNNTFKVDDFSGGLYSVGPYAINYDTDTVDNSLTFTDKCNKIVWENQSDPWGTIDPQQGGINKIDISTGVITISWYCNGYGENGVSVYTPL